MLVIVKQIKASKSPDHSVVLKLFKIKYYLKYMEHLWKIFFFLLGLVIFVVLRIRCEVCKTSHFMKCKRHRIIGLIVVY